MRTPPPPPRLSAVILQTENQVGLCVLTILGWIAASDGEISANEHAALQQIASGSKLGDRVPMVVAMVERARRRDIQLASEILRTSLEAKNKELLIEMAISMAVSDGLLTPTENYILQYLADLLGVGKLEFNSFFQKATNRPFPEPADTSRVSWWESREASNNESRRRGGNEGARDHGSQRSSSRASVPDIKTIKALAVLGLDEGASKKEIQSAFRRLSKVHHPDRFHSLGDEAVAAANISFRRIKEAYDFLTV